MSNVGGGGGGVIVSFFFNCLGWGFIIFWTNCGRFFQRQVVLVVAVELVCIIFFNAKK